MQVRQFSKIFHDISRIKSLSTTSTRMFKGTLFRKKSLEQLISDAQSGTLADAEQRHSLNKTLTVFDLTAFGIAAIIGAGIFSTIGNAAYSGGAGVVLLFIFTAIACGFSVMCYAEFASMVPISGSAYTYAYAAFGELFAWIIGWGLIMEYAVGNIVVAISWSDYFTGLLAGYGIHFPEYLSTDYFTASSSAAKVKSLLANGATLDTLESDIGNTALLTAFKAYQAAPSILGMKLVCDLPAFLITAVITTIVYIGIQESRTTTNAMVILKISVVLLVIAVGAFYVKPENWSPFMPNGFGGVMAGVSSVFFAYIGFDAISTTAEECKNPQRDLPRGMIYSLLICTVLYVLIALVLTGMTSYTKLQVGDPLAFVFGAEGVNVPWISGVIAISAVIAIASVLMVFQLGQPRIWMAMSRDGLLPQAFSKIHPKFKTPSFSTIITGLVVGVPALVVDMNVVTDLTSIGTLFAFLLVSGGVLVLEKTNPNAERKFKIPYINAKWIAPVLVALIWLGVWSLNQNDVLKFFTMGETPFLEAIALRLPLTIYFIGTWAIAYLSFKHNLSLIPVCALLSCGYLISEISNWSWFLVWLAIGLVIYFSYGRKKSKLNVMNSEK
jgi:APA family basic amino acid/polyamine antiporter